MLPSTGLPRGPDGTRALRVVSLVVLVAIADLPYSVFRAIADTPIVSVANCRASREPSRTYARLSEPQTYVRGLHRLPYHPHKISAQCLNVRLIAKLRPEHFQGLPGVVLAPVEA